MKKEFRNNMAKMFSLMERMDRHYTNLEKEIQENNFLNEAQNTDKKYHPHVNLKVAIDNNTKRRELQVKIDNLAPSDVGKVSRSYLNENYVFNSYDGIVFLKHPLKYQDITSINKNNGQEVQNNGSVNVDDDILGMLTLNENDDSSIDNGETTIKQDDGRKKETANDNDVVTWLNKDYKKLVDELTTSGTAKCYDKVCIGKLYDLESLYDSYASKKLTEQEIKLLLDKTSEEIKNEIKESLKTGDFQFLDGLITPFNIDSVILGNQLSYRNVAIIMAKYRTLTNAVLPTHVHGATEWRKFYNRRVKAGAIPYPMIGNRGGNNSPFIRGGGSVEHVSTFNNSKVVAPMIGYDISDTELIDPNIPDYYASTPGLKSNITGEKNEAAIAVITAKEKSKELINAVENVKNIYGKTALYNKIMLKYNESNLGGKAKISEITEQTPESQYISIYLNNIYAISKVIISAFGYANEEISNRLIDLLAYCIVLYTVGTGIMNNQTRNNTKLNANFEEQWSTISTCIRNIYAFIRMEISNTFSEVATKLNKLYQEAALEVQKNNTAQAEQQQQQNTVNNSENKEEERQSFNENVEHIEKLLNNLFSL